MTLVAPVECLACLRLDRSTTAPGGALVPIRCDAYPVRIPDDIRTFGDDHRTARGDEVDGRTFSLDPANTEAFADWQAFARPPDSAAAQRGKHSIDDEPRDPHSGKWIHGAGEVESIGKHAIKDAEAELPKKTTPSVHVSTKHGTFSMATEPGIVHTTWPASNGKPIEVDLSPEEANILANAINGAGSAVDDYLDGGATAKKVVGRKRVKVGGIAIVVSGIARPDDANGDAKFESPGWKLEIQLDEAEFIQSKLYDGASDADIEPVEDEDRAQKHDIAEAGHDYWVHGKGLAKWADTDDPWTELHAHLVKFMPDGEAKRTAAEWFHEVFHFWPGSDANRVTHGHPPRGKKVGPG